MKDGKLLENIIEYLKELDIVFPLIHGNIGEDGKLQGLLETFNIKYVGSNTISSALAMDKGFCKTILDKYKDTSNNLINHTPFFIWDNGNTKKKVTSVTSQLNILPTIINLLGLEYHPNYYIGKDALNGSYNGIVFFSDYSWYDGNVYVDGGAVTNNKYIDQVSLEDKNYYINYIIRKNDLTLKYNYFKKISTSKDKEV